MGIHEMISNFNPKPRRGGNRRSASRAVAFAVIAVVAGVSVATMLKSYVGSAPVRAGRKMSAVSGSHHGPAARHHADGQHLTVTPWPSGALPEGTFTNPKDLVGRVLLSRLSKNEAITAEQAGYARGGQWPEPR